MNLSLPPPPESPSDTIAGLPDSSTLSETTAPSDTITGLPDSSTLSETTAPSDISDTIAGLPDPSTLSVTTAPTGTIAGLPDLSTLSVTTTSIGLPSVEDVPKKFMDVPGGMSKGKDGIWYRNLPVNRPDGVQKMAVNAASLLTPNGFSFQEAKSALQKAIRRARPEEAVQWAFEMFSTDTGNNSAKTNLTNRLLVMALEDIGPAEPYAILVCQLLVDTISSKDPNIEEWRDIVIRITAFLASPDLKRTRCGDYICHTSDPKLHTTSESDRVVKEKYDGDVENVKAALVKVIRDKNIEMMVYLTDVLSFTGIKMTGRGNKTKAHHLIPEAFREVITGNMYVDSVLKLYSRLGSSARLIYANIILLHVNNLLPVKTDWPSYMTTSGMSGILTDSYASDALALAAGSYSDGVPKYRIPEYALDKHTLVGSKILNRSVAHFYGFGTEESPEKVYNPDPVWQPICDWLLENVIYPDLGVNKD